MTMTYLYHYQKIARYVAKWLATLMVVIFGLLFITALCDLIFGFHWSRYPWWSILFTSVLIAFALIIRQIATRALGRMRQV
jgi:hypothetical protein